MLPLGALGITSYIIYTAAAKDQNDVGNLPHSLSVSSSFSADLFYKLKLKLISCDRTTIRMRKMRTSKAVARKSPSPTAGATTMTRAMTT